MKRLILLSIPLVFTLKSLSQQTQIDSIRVDSLWRRFIIFKPQDYDTNQTQLFPLIINLHGYTSDALQQMLYTNMNAFADTSGFIVVYPYGTKDTTGYRYWNAGFSPIGANDVFFLDSLVKHLITTERVDPHGVFFCGLSNGGIMSYYMSCFGKIKIRGIGSVAGTPLASWFPCNANPTPVIHFHGTADNTVPYNGGFIPPLQDSFVAVERTVNFWKKTNYCLETPDSNFIDRDTTDGTQVIRYKWKHKTGNYYPLEFFKVLYGGHTWPGASFTYDVTTRDIHASSEIIRFFKYIYTHNIYVTGNNHPQTTHHQTNFIKRLTSNTFIALSPLTIFSLDGRLIGSLPENTVFSLPSGTFIAQPQITDHHPTILISY
ncbi:MAG: hypothetical protein GXO48_08445 [Chlorobi bacterium]|nr:hypothetical protein [Chlorobiota bacterium]